MKRERSYVDGRRNKILEIMQQQPEVKVEELAKMFEISAVTVRRDLQYLEDQKKINRFYGGASVKDEKEEQMDLTSQYRELIAKYASKFIEDGDTLFINTSSTALHLVKYIDKKNVTAITNNGRAIGIDHGDGLSIILTGGELRYPKEAMVGDFAVRNLQTIYAKKSFIGCSGISVETGMTTEIANEVNINELMINNTMGETYILADHTKIGKNSSFISCSLEKIDNLITDELVPEEVLEQFREKNVKVHIVKLEKK